MDGKADEIIQLIKEVKTKIDEEDAAEKERFAKLNAHFDDAVHSEMVEAAQLFQTLKKTDGISIASLPKAIQLPLKAFDADGDNTISPEELQHGAELYKASKDKTKMMTRLSIALGFLLVVMVGTIAAVTFALIEATKENHTGSDGAMTPAASEEGEAAAPAVSTGTATATNLLDSANSDSYFKQMNEFTMSGWDGRTLSLKVTGFYRQPCVQCSSGDVVTLATDGGFVDIVDRSVTFHPNAEFLTVDEGLAEFHTWRRGPLAAEPDASVIGRSARRLLSASTTAQVDAEATVLSAAGFTPLSTVQLKDSAGGNLYGMPGCGSKEYGVKQGRNKSKCMKEHDSSLGDNTETYAPLSTKPFGVAFATTVPDFFKFSVYKGKNGWIGYHLEAHDGDGVLSIPGHKFSGMTSGELEIFYNGVQEDDTAGTINFKKGNSNVDSFQAKYVSGTGLQASFFHEIDASDLGSNFADIMDKYPDAVASLFVEAIYAVPKLEVGYANSNSFTGIKAHVKVTLAAAVNGFDMSVTAFESSSDYGYVESYRNDQGVDFDANAAHSMSMFGTSISVDRRKLLTAGALEDQLETGLDAMLEKMTTMDVVHEGMDLDSAVKHMRLVNYLNYAGDLNDRNMDASQAEGDAAAAMLEAFEDPDSRDLVENFMGTATTEVVTAVSNGVTEASTGCTSTKKKSCGKKDSSASKKNRKNKKNKKN